jgi:hypothetical protein
MDPGRQRKKPWVAVQQVQVPPQAQVLAQMWVLERVLGLPEYQRD